MKDNSAFRVNTLIAGSGAAALNAALCLWESGMRDILIVTEQWGGGTSNNAGSDKQTYYKLSLDPSVPDSAADMAADLCRGGAMHGDIALCEAQHSLQAFYNLVRLGVPFPHNRYGSYPGYKTDHDPRARATSAGPLTSHMMFRRLAAKVEAYGIPVHNRTVLLELVTEDRPEGRTATGAIGIKTDHASDPDFGIVVYEADNVILATGGPAGIYRDSVYPESQTGSIGMALKAGAVAQNLAISQFGISSVKFRWNLSGSYQQVIPRYFSTGQDGEVPRGFLEPHFTNRESLFTAIFLKGYQWPYDPKKVDDNGSSRVDLAVQQEKAAGRRVWIDFTRNPSGLSADDLPALAADYLGRSGAIAETPADRLKLLNQPAIDLYMSHGIDITREALEIAVSAQHNNGGLAGDIWWESNIRGLFPVGEVNGTHGITRPGGSALNSGQVGGVRAAMGIVNRDALRVTRDTRDRDEFNFNPNSESQAVVHVSRSSASRVTLHDKIYKMLSGCGHLDYRTALTELRSRMSDHAGPVRDASSIGREVAAAWKLWDRLNNDLKAVKADEIPAALRTFDLCLTHAVYLEAVAEDLRFTGDKEKNILEVWLDDRLRVQKRWVPVRPVPQEELWFEKTWREFREDREKEEVTE
jgi:succinate dehydrogenase/fumarate reductase flavoprotein subunit